MKSRHLIVFLGLLISLVIFAGSVSAQGDNSAAVVVVATGDDTADCERFDLPGVFVTQDVCNVQAAVDANPGGKIMLKGTFHFAEYGYDGYVVPGTDGTVFITSDIEIVGETRGRRSLTTIKGGYYTFSIGHTPTEWAFDLSDDVFSSSDNAVPVKATIKDLEFENALLMTIRIWATTGSTIKNNRIDDGRSLSTEEFFGTGGHSSGIGIAALPPGGFFDENPHLISGNIDIVDNSIDGMYRRADADDPWAAPSFGISVRGISQGGVWLSQYEADVTIKNNQVYNTGIAGILSGGNDGTTIIKDNLVHIVAPDPEVLPYTEGIRAWGAYFYYSEVAAYVIKGNEITVGGSPGGWGVYVDWALAPVVGDNRIHLSSPAEAGILLWDVANATVVDNDFEGSGEYGLVLGHPQYPPCCFNDGNTLKGNNLADFAASVADYYLGIDVTNNILHVEEEDLVLDESGNDTNIIILD